MPKSKQFFYLLFFFTQFLYFLIYYPGLYGDFEFDDNVNILNNTSLQIHSLSFENLKQTAFSGHAGPTKRPVSIISFSLNHYFSGFSPKAFKLTNIIIHLINGILFLIFTVQLLKAFPKIEINKKTEHILFFALILSFTWLITPINLTSVLYIVQRMTSLSALFVLLALIIYIHGRQQDVKKGNGRYTLIYSIFTASLAGLFGVFSKENAALLPAYLLLIESFVFKFRSSHRYSKIALQLYLGTSLLLLTYLIAPDFPIKEWAQSAYAFRPFNLSERLLTEARVLINYIYLTIFPNNQQLGIYHDDIVISTSLTTPLSTLGSIVLLGLMFSGAVYYLRKNPLLSFSILWFFISHLMESTFIPLELMHEHRNYLASYGVLLFIYSLLFQLKQRIKQRKILYILILIYISHIGITTYNRSSQWSNLALHAKLEAENHPDSYRAQYQLARIYFMYFIKTQEDKYYTLAEQQFNHLSRLNSQNLDKDIGKIILLSVSNKPDAKNREEQLLDALTKKIKGKYIPANQVGTINTLNECQLKKQCWADSWKYIAFLNTLIRDTHMTNTSLAFVHIYAGDYYREKLKEYSQAIKHYNKARQLAPEKIQFQIRYLVGLANTGQTDKAINYLQVIRANDQFGLYKTKLQELESELNSIKRKSH